MHVQYNRVRLLFLPSVLSASVTLGVAAVFLGRNGWQYISHEQLFYDYLFGAYGLRTLLLQTTPGVVNHERAVLDTSLAYHVMLLGVAIVIGLLVYTCLQAVGLVSHGAKELFHDVEYAEPIKRKAVLHQLMVRLGLRVLTLAGWVGYTIYFLATLVPYTIALTQQGIDDIQASKLLGWLLCVAAGLLLALALHIHAIFLRLYLLRVRVFGAE